MAFALTAAACAGGQEDLDHEVKKEQFTSSEDINICGEDFGGHNFI